MDHEYMKTLVIVAFLSMFGGLVDAIMRYRAEGKRMSFKNLMLKTALDLVLAAFAGAVTFWIMEYVTGGNKLNGLMCATIAMSGYLGGKAIDIAATAWQSIIKASATNR